MSGVVIVGAGHAGVQAAVSLGEYKYDGPIALLDSQAGTPYQRPPLSKEFMKGEIDAPPALRPLSYFERKGVEFRGGERGRVEELDLNDRGVRTATGEWLPYEQLILATGARSRPVPIPGVDLDGVFELRRLSDAEALRSKLADSESVVVVGGGFIGLEFAACARTLGKTVVVIEAQDVLMGRSATAITADQLHRTHLSAGTDIWLSSPVAGIADAGSGRLEVAPADGRTVVADLVLVGVGVLPDTTLAKSVGISAADGVDVDDDLRTDADPVFAIGDCAAGPLPGGRRGRLESVQSAAAHARAVARVIAGVEPVPHEVPWFWSDQLDVRLQIAGICAGADREIVKRDPAGGSFAVLCLEEDRLVGAETINSPRDHVAVRKILESGQAVGPDMLEQPDLDLTELALDLREKSKPAS